MCIIGRLLVQRSGCKGLLRAGSRSVTRSPAQKSACKDLKRNGQDRAITLKAAYTPTSKRAGSRLQKSRLDHVELIKAAFLTYTTMANNYLTCFGVP